MQLGLIELLHRQRVSQSAGSVGDLCFECILLAGRDGVCSGHGGQGAMIVKGKASQGAYRDLRCNERPWTISQYRERRKLHLYCSRLTCGLLVYSDQKEPQSLVRADDAILFFPIPLLFALILFCISGTCSFSYLRAYFLAENAEECKIRLYVSRLTSGLYILSNPKKL